MDEVPISEVDSIVQAVEHELDDTDSESERISQTTPPEQLEASAKDALIRNGVENPTYDQIKALLSKELTLEYKAWDYRLKSYLNQIKSN